MLQVVRSLLGRKERETADRQEGYQELVERLAQEPEDSEPTERELVRVEAVLTRAGRSPDDLASDIEAARERSRLERIVADADKRRRALGGADEAVEELDRARREVWEELTAKIQGADAARQAARRAVAEVADAERRLAEIQAAKPESLARRQRLRELAERRAKTESLRRLLPRLPEAGELQNARAELKAAAAAVSDVAGPSDFRLHRRRELAEQVEALEQREASRPRHEAIDRDLAAIDAEIASVKAEAIA